jgi:methionine sulfoxide reductase catalytic subunit
MSTRIRFDRDIRPSEITPESIAFGRRRLLGAAAGLALTWGSGATSASPPHGSELFRSVPKGRYSTDEAPTPIEIATTRTRFRELEEDIAKNGEAYTPYPWKVSVEGACTKPRVFDLDDLLTLAPLEERTYRMLCTEGWLHIVPYIGYPLSEILKRVEPTSNAKYVEFTALLDPKQFRGQREITYIDWPYVEGLRMDEAMHPLTILAVGMYGKTLTNQQGAPIRLVVPWKYGFKGIKSIVRIRFVDRQPSTAWQVANPEEYGFYSNVNPEVDHPRWSQATERRIPGYFKNHKTLMFNGYGDQVASLYAGLDLRKNY